MPANEREVATIKASEVFAEPPSFDCSGRAMSQPNPLPTVDADPTAEVAIGESHYRKSPYAPPERGTLYTIRDKSKNDRIIRVVDISADGAQIGVEVVDEQGLGKKRVHLSSDSLARQAAVGWCHVLLPVSSAEAKSIDKLPAASDVDEDDAVAPLMRLDIQNFSRCGADIVRAKIQFDTQLIKDVGDGPFRAGNYEHAFRTFEQLALGFTTAVKNSRRAVADGRRKLTSEKGKLSGKEIQERTAAFVRSEQLIHTAEREFSTILEGLRMYLRSRQDDRSEAEQGE
jgi:hypothetical protein